MLSFFRAYISAPRFVLLGLILSSVSCGGGGTSSTTPDPPLPPPPPPAVLVAPPAQPYDVVIPENLKKGNGDWGLSSPASNHEIEGYASAVSVNRGETIQLFVNTAEPSYTIDIYRLGWYGGAGGLRILPTITRQAVIQPPPVTDPNTYMVECNWIDPYDLTIPDSDDHTDWPSGIYLAKLTSSISKKQSYITFVVRDDNRSADLMFQVSVNTYQAYNSWGGYSLYTDTTHPQNAYKVSFNRPYINGYGAGDIIGYGWEISAVRFLEREGYDVAYSTDLDTHLHGERLLNYKGFLVVGHDEYWTWQMRDNIETIRDQGVNLGFVSANEGYWQVRYEPSPITSGPNRTMVCYKSGYSTAKDPVYSYLTTTRFRDKPVSRPEETLVGMMYDVGAHGMGDIHIEDAQHWVFQGTDLKNGDLIQGLLGYEEDVQHGLSPLGTERLAHSPFNSSVDGSLHYGDMTVYTANSGARVVAIGSMDWNLGLDTFYKGKAVSSVQQATRNILQNFGAKHP